nr:hypothetical protein [Lacrimispora saccharolytica]
METAMAGAAVLEAEMARAATPESGMATRIVMAATLNTEIASRMAMAEALVEENTIGMAKMLTAIVRMLTMEV